tara:strand:- start:16 stop:228 length:213 start_codon:yes stop_codon:yes gene_type:complete
MSGKIANDICNLYFGSCYELSLRGISKALDCSNFGVMSTGIVQNSKTAKEQCSQFFDRFLNEKKVFLIIM